MGLHSRRGELVTATDLLPQAEAPALAEFHRRGYRRGDHLANAARDPLGSWAALVLALTWELRRQKQPHYAHRWRPPYEY